MFSSQNSQVSEAFNYIEDVFSTYLYTGNGSTQTITNGIDLAGKGGLTWIKYRDGTFGNGHYLYDTVRGAGKALQSNLTDAETAVDSRLTSFNSNGFSLSTAGGSGINANTYNYVSWTFREQPKFFDVVTYTGDGTAGRTVPHNLGSVPGCIMVKNISRATDWIVYHTSVGATGALYLNTSTATVTATSFWNNTSPTSTQFTTGTWTGTNYSGDTFVAYLFAHNAGGFGLTGTDNVISCGSFTTDGTGAAGNITLGYESQLVMFKRSDGVGNWQIVDTMRGSSLTSYNYISPTVSNAESSSTSTQGIYPTATGFYVGNNFPGANQTYVYMAIRRGPMKVPTLGTSVYNAIARTGTGATANVTGVGFSPDLVFAQRRAGGDEAEWFDRLRGPTKFLWSPTTDAEQTDSLSLTSFDMDGFSLGTDASWGKINFSGRTYINWALKRASGFFDEVCYTGDSTNNRAITHNLGVTPELWIIKSRSNGGNWEVYSSYIASNQRLRLNSTAAADVNVVSSASSTTFTVNFSGSDAINFSPYTYVAYLFATCAGVSKVGSYTGTGALQTVACGFTSGARFVLIKRTDSTGDWYVWDSARGISSGNDPYLLLNTAGAEVTTTNYVDTDTTGFKVTAAAPAGINASGGTYIFLAIA